MQEEIDRLRALVGPDEVAYATMQDDLTAASAEARARETELGSLRSQLLLAERQLHRAERRNGFVAQYLRVQRGVLRRARGLFGASPR